VFGRRLHAVILLFGKFFIEIQTCLESGVIGVVCLLEFLVLDLVASGLELLPGLEIRVSFGGRG
jgi:hypothetical protein